VGEGQLGYHVLDDNSELTWEAGPQGGYHVWLAVRMKGLRQSGTVVTIHARDDDDHAQRVLSDRRVIFSFRRDEGGFCTLSGLRLQLDEDPGVNITSLEGHHIRVTVSAADPEGSAGSDQVIIIVRGPRVDAGP